MKRRFAATEVENDFGLRRCLIFRILPGSAFWGGSWISNGFDDFHDLARFEIRGDIPYVFRFVRNPDLCQFHLWFFTNPETQQNDPKLK